MKAKCIEAFQYQYIITGQFSILYRFYLFIDKLKAEKSKVLDNWPSLMIKLQSERDLAEENAEYLSTLQEFFIVSIIVGFSLLFYSFFLDNHVLCHRRIDFKKSYILLIF
jgi:hypothetical protein